MSDINQSPRFAPGSQRADGGYEFSWQLTSCRFTDPVILQIPPADVLPVIFVPGIMGSNLRGNSGSDNPGQPVWRLDNSSYLNWADWFKDKPLSLAGSMATAPPAERQRILHPDRVEVDSDGAVPKKAAGSVYDVKRYTDRGWGEVGEGSYHGFLLWLEQVLNGQGYSPATWPQFSYTAVSAAPKPGERPRTPPLTKGISMSMQGLPAQGEKGPMHLLSDDLIARARFRMPVYACGYNWLDSNIEAAKRLRQRILDVIKENSHEHSRCSQVVLVTHSMGGLVARACQQPDGMQEAIAGIVHGVMPSVGAAVAYRRCKIGMADEDPVAAMVIGSTGQEVTAVFAQAPGALQLLPARQYRSGWLTVDGPSGKSLETEPHTGNPYKDIYKRRDRWWGLIREEWLNPPGGTGLNWIRYEKNLEKAADFHDDIQDAYHPNTYVFYGANSKATSFEGVRWKIERGMRPDDKPPPPDAVSKMSFADVRDNGSNPLYVGGKTVVIPDVGYLESSYWELVCAMQDGGGDGTVPISSGAFPLRSNGAAIQQQVGLPDIEHEPAYHDKSARLFTLYALQKIAAKARATT